MSIFENIIFLNEARTKEEYLAQKEEEAKKKEEDENAERERFDRRYKVDARRAFGQCQSPRSLGNKYDTSEYIINGKNTQNNPNYSKKTSEDHRRISKINKIIQKDIDAIPHNKRNVLTQDGKDIVRKSNFMQKADSINRHMRRHPDMYKESNLFNMVNFI